MHRLRIYFTFHKFFYNDSCDGCSIIDLGCNEGTYSVLFKAKGFDVDGLDICDLSKAFELSKKYNMFVNYHSSPIEKPKIDKKFDYIFCSEVLEHIDDINRGLLSLKTLAHPHTKIIISLPNVLSIYGILRFIRDMIRSGFDFSKIDPHQKFPPWYVKKLFNKHDYSIKIIGSVNYFPFNIFPNFNLRLSKIPILNLLGYSTFYSVHPRYK